MLCPNCKEKLKENQYNHTCSKCGLKINKTILGKKLNPDEIKTLCSQGKTPLIKGFKSKKGTYFDAFLTVKGNKITFVFPDKPKKNYKTEILVKSISPGNVYLKISGNLNYRQNIHFGLMPPYQTELLAIVAALRLLQYKNHLGPIKIGAYSQETVEFIKNSKSTSKELREIHESLKGSLSAFSTWETKYIRQKKNALQGGIKYMNFPKGLFPWLKVRTKEFDDCIRVDVPKCPSVKCQLKSAIPAATKDDNCFIIPPGSYKAFSIWLKEVTQEEGSN